VNLNQPEWSQIAALMDETWFLSCPTEEIVARLLQRHQAQSMLTSSTFRFRFLFTNWVIW
jgi:hypothetical protein